MEDIEGWRLRIDQVDEEIVALLNRRMSYVLEIGRIKRLLGEPVYAPLREARVLERVKEMNSGPLGGDAIMKLYQHIIHESRLAEEAFSDSEELKGRSSVGGVVEEAAS